MSHNKVESSRVTGQHDYWEIGLVFSPFLVKIKIKKHNFLIPNPFCVLIQQHAIKELIRLKLGRAARERTSQMSRRQNIHLFVSSKSNTFMVELHSITMTERKKYFLTNQKFITIFCYSALLKLLLIYSNLSYSHKMFI